MPHHYIFLLLAIATEVIGTIALVSSDQFTRVGPSILVVVGYMLSFYFLALTLQHMPVGVVYAIWSGLGLVSVAAIGYLVFEQRLDPPALVGMGLIVTGVLVINLFSASASH